MDALYGPDVSTHRVLSGEVATPESADRFIDAVRQAKAQAIASK
jgi:lipid-binding SYLF domain-containing protein